MKHLLIILLATSLYFTANGQDSVKQHVVTRQAVTATRRSLDTNRIIYDELGNALHYYQYTKLLNSGEYTLKSTGLPGEPGVKSHLVKMTTEDKVRMQSFLKAQMSIKSALLQEGMHLDLTPFLTNMTEQQFDKKAILLIFWSVDCPPCTEDFGSLNDYFKTLANPDDLLIVAIARNNERMADAKLIQKPLLYAQMLNNSGDIYNYYHLASLPSYVVADKDHIIRFATSGSSPITMPSVKKNIGELLAK